MIQNRPKADPSIAWPILRTGLLIEPFFQNLIRNGPQTGPSNVRPILRTGQPIGSLFEVPVYRPHPDLRRVYRTLFTVPDFGPQPNLGACVWDPTFTPLAATKQNHLFLYVTAIGCRGRCLTLQLTRHALTQTNLTPKPRRSLSPCSTPKTLGGPSRPTRVAITCGSQQS